MDKKVALSLWDWLKWLHYGTLKGYKCRCCIINIIIRARTGPVASSNNRVRELV